MDNPQTFRIIKVASELGVAVSTLTDHLNHKGFAIEAKPTAKITREMHDLLYADFKNDKFWRDEAKALEIESSLIRANDVQKEDPRQNFIAPITRKSPSIIQKKKIQSTSGSPEFISTSHYEKPRRTITFSPEVFSIPSEPQDNNLVAVMMPFAKEFQEVYKSMKYACRQVKFDCKRADDIWVNSTIMQNIFHLIFISRIVIADFTGKNTNVFYEVGVAHTLGKVVIPITQNLEDVPADLRHHKVLKYLPNTEGLRVLEADLAARLRILAGKAIYK